MSLWKMSAYLNFFFQYSVSQSGSHNTWLTKKNLIFPTALTLENKSVLSSASDVESPGRVKNKQGCSQLEMKTKIVDFIPLYVESENKIG